MANLFDLKYYKNRIKEHQISLTKLDQIKYTFARFNLKNRVILDNYRVRFDN